LTEIKRSAQYLEVKAFADRFAISGLVDGLKKIREKVMKTDPLGFMQILADEAVASAQTADIERGVTQIVETIAANQPCPPKQRDAIRSRAWAILSLELAGTGVGTVKPKRRQTQSSASTSVSDTVDTLIRDESRALAGIIKTTYNEDNAFSKARQRMYKSDEMRDTIYALQHQFYITSENHYPARWSTFQESIYCTDTIEYDNPAHALPTQVAQALGMPFYRAFTFSLNEALMQQNFRSGYKRDPLGKPPFHAEQIQSDERMEQDVRQGSRQNEESPFVVLQENALGLDSQPVVRPGSPIPTQSSLRDKTPQPSQSLQFGPTSTSQGSAPASYVSPQQQQVHTQSSNGSPRSFNRQAFTAPLPDRPSQKTPPSTGFFKPPPSRMYPPATKVVKKQSQMQPAEPEVKQEHEGVLAVKDEFEYSGQELWEEIWVNMKSHLETGQSGARFCT
jgi:hypothetical protein